jgi:asparagine synthase (glutamine-hydrolysing)
VKRRDSVSGGSVHAATHGLDLTRPFHDKRVVELGLAIPEQLFVRGGRNRYLALAALGGLYPPEFRDRGRLDDDVVPDFQRVVKSVEPGMLTDIARMEKSARLDKLADFGQIRTWLAARGVDDHNSGWEQETQLALHRFLIARYVEWFQRHNQPG